MHGVAKRYEYGSAGDGEDDILVVQGREYPMNPVGMRAIRRILDLRKRVDPNRKDDDPLTEDELDVALEIVTGAVRPEVREAFAEHIEDSVPPVLLVAIAGDIMRSFSDVDPTQQALSSNGSTPTGSDSADGAQVVASTLTT